MKIVIDLDVTPEEFKKIQVFNIKMMNSKITHKVYEAVQKGIVLPEEHGRLIDADKITYFRCPNNVNDCPPSYDFKCQSCDYGVTSKFRVDRLPTIIEADKGEEE